MLSTLPIEVEKPIVRKTSKQNQQQQQKHDPAARAPPSPVSPRKAGRAAAPAPSRARTFVARYMDTKRESGSLMGSSRSASSNGASGATTASGTTGATAESDVRGSAAPSSPASPARKRSSSITRLGGSSWRGPPADSRTHTTSRHHIVNCLVQVEPGRVSWKKLDESQTEPLLDASRANAWGLEDVPMHVDQTWYVDLNSDQVKISVSRRTGSRRVALFLSANKSTPSPLSVTVARLRFFMSSLRSSKALYNALTSAAASSSFPSSAAIPVVSPQLRAQGVSAKFFEEDDDEVAEEYPDYVTCSEDDSDEDASSLEDALGEDPASKRTSMTAKDRSLAAAGEPAAIRFLKANPPPTPTRYWADADAETFKVRGRTYVTDKEKVDSHAAIMTTVAIDLLTTPRMWHLSRHPQLRLHQSYANDGVNAPFCMVVNIIIPNRVVSITAAVTDPRLSAALKFPTLDESELPPSTWSDEPSGYIKMARKFLCGSDPEFHKQRFKIIFRLREGPLLLRGLAPANKPILLATKVPIRFYNGPNYLELDIDTARDRIADKITTMAANQAKIVAVDLAFFIEGREESELPERALFACSFSHVDFAAARVLEPLLTPDSP